MNREEWLTRCKQALRDDFLETGYELPENIRVSCSFPSKKALAKKSQRIGEAWTDKASGDRTFEVFVSPVLSDSVDVAAILVHELVHCAVGLQCGHRGAFRLCAKRIGLEGKMTATTAGEELRKRLEEITSRIGRYPHAKLSSSNAAPKQSTRMKKVECSDCGCIVRMTRKWLEECGAPTCACGEKMLPVEAE